MSHSGNGHAMSLEEVRSGVVKRLRNRRSGIEEVLFARARAVSDQAGWDAEYLAGLRATVTAVVDYVLIGIERGEDWPGPIPSVAVAQAQLAARNGVGLETVWLRYAAGQRHLEGFVMAEADHFPSQALRHVVEMQWSLLERLMTTISAEYHREVARVASSLEQRRGQRLRRLLAGESTDLGEFEYEFNDAWHLGIIAIGARAHEAVRDLAAGCERRLLSLSSGKNTVWAWLGGNRLAVADVDFRLPAMRGQGALLAVGEPSRGVNGWRLTHHQAQAALLVALYEGKGITLYAEVMLLGAALQNETLAKSLEMIYLLPISGQKDGGKVWRETLHAYFAAQGNTATAANALDVGRHTVERRLRSIEKTLGRLISTCRPELEVALRMSALRSRHTSADASVPYNATIGQLGPRG